MITITELEKIKENLFKIKWKYEIDDDILNSLKEIDPKIYDAWHNIQVGHILTTDKYFGDLLGVTSVEGDIITVQSAEPLNTKLQVGMHLLKLESARFSGEYDEKTCCETIN